MKLTVKCPQCGGNNRFTVERVIDGPLCAACRRPLAGQIVRFEQQDFDYLVKHAPLPVLIDYYASWCGPCRTLGPVLEDLAARYRDRMLVAKLDIDTVPLLAERFSIRSVPTMQVFNRAKLVDTLVGALPPAALEARLKSVLGLV